MLISDWLIYNNTDLSLVRNHLNLGNSVKKLFKTQDFQKFMKGDVRVPYRDLYPDAPESEWKRKGTNQEKSGKLKVVGNDFFTINLFSSSCGEVVGCEC